MIMRFDLLGLRGKYMAAGCPGPTALIGTTVIVNSLSESMEYSRVVSTTNIVSFSPLVVLVMVTL